MGMGVVSNTRVNPNTSVLISALATSSFSKHHSYGLALPSTSNFPCYTHIIFKAPFRLSRSLPSMLDFVISTYKSPYTLLFPIFSIFSTAINFFPSLTWICTQRFYLNHLKCVFRKRDANRGSSKCIC